ncbi:amino acid ABC transporter ATP-binding/permease protein [Maritimibacter alkaliphilus]|uniref:amino acid ABC transporter ATP-binding/permease protein n=1 Tax=Maritimibacter alkaliphilus TaxID=404236 RepID=UPI001C98C46E|nr:ATP-binding cassette domain-containing protein [Maritimibacter alkaliphilus]MBY6091002.1 ATP-binding cassette domain-containing protein [Maritimibacter alkaliphilus]
MRQLWRVLRLLWSARPWGMWRGAVLSVVVLVMGAALLGLSGWFITATGMAGLAGIGIAFDVFRPSAGVRMLALGRAAARYAERLLTHDATLSALAVLRLDLLKRLSARPLAELRQLRGGVALTRITADVDALDGVALRLALPIASALLTHCFAFLMLWWLVTLPVALTVTAGYLGGAGVILYRVGRRGFGPSSRAEAAGQEMRRAAIGLFRGQRDLILQGRMPAARAALTGAETEARAAHDLLDRLDARAGLALATLVALVTTAVMVLALHAVQSGAAQPAAAAIGVFAALALAETVMPLRRGLAELGRMRDAAERVLSQPEAAVAGPKAPLAADTAAGLRVQGLTLTRPDRVKPLAEGLSFVVAIGETVAIRGESGSGKSTLLDVLARVTPSAGAVHLLGQRLEDYPEDQLRRLLTLVPQRSALMGGTIRQNLALARADVSDDAAWQALRAVALDGVIAERGGLEAMLGEGGAGLSGGEARRLVLARTLLRRPAVLLLDEATEGLDDVTARKVLSGIRETLPEVALLLAAHRHAELEFADRIIQL